MVLKKNKGFTIIELLVVIAIIGILTTVGVIALTTARENARTTKAQADLTQIRKAMEILANDTGEWPGHQTIDSVCTSCSGNELCSDGCTNTLGSAVGGLTQDDSGTPYNDWNGPYIGVIPLDPWGNEYFFDTDYDVGGDDKAALGSYGPNGQGNNDYDSDDIILILAE